MVTCGSAELFLSLGGREGQFPKLAGPGKQKGESRGTRGAFHGHVCPLVVPLRSAACQAVSFEVRNGPDLGPGL